MLRAELRCNDIEPVVSKWRLGQRGHFEVFHVVWSALSYVIDIFKDETVKAVTEEQKKAIFSVLSGRDTFVCLQTTVSLWTTKLLRQKPVWYHVVKITRCHGNSCTCATENVSDLGRGLFSFEFPAQIETSASREIITALARNMHGDSTLITNHCCLSRSSPPKRMECKSKFRL